MLHALISQRYFVVVLIVLSLTLRCVPARAQDEGSEGNEKKPEKKAASSKSKEKPDQKKKKEAAKKSGSQTEEKEKRPQLQILGSKVGYNMPRRWTKPQVSTRNKLEALQFAIPLPSASISSRMTSAIVVAEPNADKLTLADFSNGKLPRKYPASTVIADQLDGDSWRTVVSHVTEATPPYTIVDRFGVAAGVRVHFRLLLPKEDSDKATWPQTLAQEGNTFLDGLAISGKNKVAHHLFYDKGNWGLREGKPSRKAPSKDTATESDKNKKAEVKKAAAKKVAPKPTPKKKETPAPTPSAEEAYEQ